MSEESLRKTGYFDVAGVRKHFERYLSGKASTARFFLEMGLISVLSTQLWHHMYLGGGLCELPETHSESEGGSTRGRRRLTPRAEVGLPRAIVSAAMPCECRAYTCGI